ncbi:MAG TPA: ATP-binding protein [Pilimelia sp.]|nr:ATP-binding protein [Pilimelia sp.]
MGSVLVVEDDLDRQEQIARISRGLGLDVAVADDGHAGLLAMAAHRPDVVVADADMPRLSGLQLCRAMREDPGLAEIPVVLVTARLPPGDARFRAAGAAAVLGEPWDDGTLSDALHRYAGGPAHARRPGPGAPGGTPTAEDGGDGIGDAVSARFGRALLDSVDVGLIACDANGRLVLLNSVLRDFFGPESRDLPVTDWPRRFVLRHHDGSPLTARELPLVRALNGQHVHRANLMTHDLQGRPRWFAVNARPIRDGAGEVLGAVAAVHDITADFRARQYHDCKTEVLRVLAGNPDAIAAGQQLVDAVGATLRWTFVRLWLIDEVTGRLHPHATYTAPGQDPLPVPRRLARGAGLAGRCWQRGEPLWVPDLRAPGSPVVPEVAAVATVRAAGAVPVRSGPNIIGVLTFFSPDRQEPEAALSVLLSGIAGNIGAYIQQRRSEELATHLAATTDEYIALVGHELRTPLTSIGLYTDLVAQAADLDEARRLAEVIQRNNHQLRGLVDRLLELAALDAGHLGLAIAEVDLAALVRDRADAARAAAPHARVTADAPAALTVPGDPERLRQLVDALLDNATRYSRGDCGVTVSLRDEEDVAVLVVTDTGGGVPEPEQPLLFRRLYRGRNARHTGIPGAGLGLALSRAVAERHHGTIALNSGPRGTTVTVRLPRTGG